MTNYQNEIDPFAAQWLRNLILAGQLPLGNVDTRSITELSPDDLRGYTQCHFFGGIGTCHRLSICGPCTGFNAAEPRYLPNSPRDVHTPEHSDGRRRHAS